MNSENKNIEILKNPKFIIAMIIVIIIIFISPKKKSSSNENSKSDCNCEYEDGAGNKKRFHALDYRDCVNADGGDWLGYDADYEVK